MQRATTSVVHELLRHDAPATCRMIGAPLAKLWGPEGPRGYAVCVLLASNAHS